MLRKTFQFTLLILVLMPVLLSGQELDIKDIEIIDVRPVDHVCKLPPTDHNAHFYIKASPELLERIRQKSTTSFHVDYFSSCTGEQWPQEAVLAFEFAMSIWSSHINSEVPIKINANWVSMEGNTLGSARPSRIVQISSAGRPDTWYTLAHLSALTGRPIRDQLDDISYDIDMNVNCEFNDWYFGTDANVPEGKSDFVTVVLHEIGHGIGFLGSMEANNDSGVASWGVPDDNRQPLIFDHFAVDDEFNYLIDSPVYPNPSENLYDALIGERGGVYFEGIDANNSLVGLKTSRARLYTPDPFNEGSSYSHLDQDAFRQSVNALMLPFIDRAFAIHTPGPLFCGILSDMGWPLGDGCLDFINSPIMITDKDQLNFGVVNTNETALENLQIRNREDAELTLDIALQIESDEFSVESSDNFIVEPGGVADISISFSPTNNGGRSGTLNILHNARNLPNPLILALEGEALNVGQIVQLDQSYPNPFVSGGSQGVDSPIIEFAISESSDVKLDLYTISGRYLFSLVDDRREPGRYQTSVNMQGLSSGIYIYRILVNGESKTGKLMYMR